MSNINDFVGINMHKPPIRVAHSELRRVDAESPHKSICPECNQGWLLMMRNPQPPHFILNTDRCLLCGQTFVYYDIPNNQLFLLKL